MMASLYELDKALRTVIEGGLVFDEETGEVYFDEENLAELVATRNDKLEACAVVVKELEADAAALKAEAEKLMKRRQAAERKAERLRRYVADSMELFGDEKIETPKASLKFRRSSFVDVHDVSALPREFVRVKTTETADKAAIGKAIKAGQDVEGAELCERKTLVVG